jgi:hypothetical protein
MGKETKITCDRCLADIGYTNYHSEYRLAIINEPRANTGGACFAMAIPPHLNSNVYFCNARCLKQWVNANIYKDEK